jgi:hypothetical protein
VLEVEILQNEASALASPGTRIALLKNPWRVVVLFIGVIGGFFCAVILSAMLSHPAGAAVLPGVNGGVPGQPSNSGQSVVSEVAAIPDTTQSPVSDVTPLVPSVVNTASPIVDTAEPPHSANRQLARQALSPAIGVALQSVAPSLGPDVAVLTPIGRPADGLGFSTAPELISQPVSVPASTQTSLSSPAASGLAFHSAPTAPMPQPLPNGPAPQDPVTPSGSTTDSSLPSFGSSPLAGHPALGPLMPAPMVTGFVFGRCERPELLLDLRSSPPG